MRENNMPKGIPNKYPLKVLKFVKENVMNFTYPQLVQMIDELFGIKYHPETLRKVSRNNGIVNPRTGRFVKGQKSFNKGKKIEEYCSAEVIEKIKRTQFKPGNCPVNAHPIGAVVIRADGYAWIKVNNNPGKHNFAKRWKMRSHINWEEVNGPVPKGHVLLHLDGNKLNDEITNLKLIQKGATAIIARQFGYDKNQIELMETKANIASLEYIIGMKIKERGENNAKE